MLPQNLTHTAARLWREDARAHAQLLASASHPLTMDAAAWSVWAWACSGPLRLDDGGVRIPTRDRLSWGILAAEAGLLHARLHVDHADLYFSEAVAFLWKRRHTATQRAIWEARRAGLHVPTARALGDAPDEAWAHR